MKSKVSAMLFSSEVFFFFFFEQQFLFFSHDFVGQEFRWVWLDESSAPRDINWIT